MTLTSEQLAILAHIVVDPQAWADHAEASLGEDAVVAKVEKYRDAYLTAKDSSGYMTRAERDGI